MNNVIRRGDRGAYVEKLQSDLRKLGYGIATDGIFGAGTESVVKHFQHSAELLPDGIVGARTMLAISQRIEKDWQVPLAHAASQAKLNNNDIVNFANKYGLDVAAVKAVCEVESRGAGFRNGRIIILFEGHVFWRQLARRKINPSALVNGNENILHRKWTNRFYKFDQYQRLEKAKRINKDAALESASYGLFQVMGFHWQALGFDSVVQFVEYMEQNEANQLEVFGRFIRANNLLSALRSKDWATFARRYNGPGYKKNKYDTKLANAFRKYSAR